MHYHASKEEFESFNEMENLAHILESLLSAIKISNEKSGM